MRPENPQRRDVQLLRGYGHMVIQFDPQPGMWSFHCHIARACIRRVRQDLLVEPDKVKGFSILDAVAQTCRNWGTWTDTNIPDQIDSGM